MSTKKCCVPNCKTTRSEKVPLHLFPNPNKDIERFNLWKTAIGGSVLTLDSQTIFDNRRVCHLHFESFYYTRSKRLSPNAIPTINLSELTKKTPIKNVSTQNVVENNEIKALKKSKDSFKFKLKKDKNISINLFLFNWCKNCNKMDRVKNAGCGKKELKI